MLHKILISILALSLILPARASAGIRHMCEGYSIESERPIKFNANERKLICGDPEAESWEDIPRFQAEYFIKTFLQQRGYYFPKFQEEDGQVIIVPGNQTHITEIEIEGSPPPNFQVWHRRQIKGALLTPDNLSALEGWAKTKLMHIGFGCPAVSSTADAETGKIFLNITPGPKQTIIDVTEDPVEGLRPGTLRRFDAFNIGDTYDHLNLKLTSRRIVSDGILQSSHFLTECMPDGVKITQKNIPGGKRLVSVGLGGSTEEYFIAKATWKQSRIGKNGSSFQIAGRFSFRKQRFFIQSLVYPLPFPSRWHLRPTFISKRENEKQYEYVANDLWATPAVTWDTQNTGYRLMFGPKLNYTRTIKGAQKGWTHFFSLAASLDIASHDYEYFLADPRTGYVISTEALLNSDKVLSSITAQKLTLSGEALWNIADLEPPLLVFGIRGLAGTTITDFNSPAFARLPPQFLYYMGGTANLRGFSRKQLPNANRGALTALYAGAEIRLANVLPLNLQPIAFIDVGATGQKPLELNFPAYWSPGFGIRWPSFIGVFRFMVAHGYLINNQNPANNNLSHWQFSFTLGEEF